MNGDSKRPKRKTTIKTEADIEVPRKWKAEEMEKLLHCIMEHGHKNIEKIQECIPHRSLESIKIFMRTIHDNADKISEGHPEIDGWLNRCSGKSLSESAWKDSLQIAQTIKYLSVDGLLENHPLPERCQGVNFSEAYRLIYQALLGYPIQPVNEATIYFIQQILKELKDELKQETGVVEKMTAFLTKISRNDAPIDESEISTDNSTEDRIKKPVKVYGRKKPKLITVNESTPSLKIVVEANSNKNTEPSSTRDFSVTIHGTSTEHKPAVVNVPVPFARSFQSQVDKDEQELLQSSSYNPFKIPEKGLNHPIYLNIMKNL